MWRYAALAATEGIHHYVAPDDDVDSVPALIVVRDVPSILLLAVRDIQTSEEADKLLNENDEALRSIMGKLDSDISNDKLPVYDKTSLLRVGTNQLSAYKGNYLVRFDDLEAWFMSEGIQLPATLLNGAGTPSNDKNVQEEKEIGGKSETAYLHIIGALCDLYWREVKPDCAKINQSEIIAALDTYRGYAGLSERNLKDKLSKAIKMIRTD